MAKIRIETTQKIIILNKRVVGVIRHEGGTYSISGNGSGIGRLDKLTFKQIYKAMGQMIEFEKGEK